MSEGMLRLRADRLTWREVGGEIVALDLVSSTYFTANDTGSTIIRALAEGASRGELVDALLEAFEVTPDQAGADVDAFVADLAEHGLLE